MKRKTESGEVVVEATIVVTIVVVFVAVFVYLGMILYQRTMLSVVANQTAENIAAVYSNNIKDPFTGFLDEDELYQDVTYNSMKNDAYVEVVEQKATVLARYRLESYRILGNNVEPEVEVQLVRKPNEILKSQIVVSIKDAYELPFVGFFNAIGLFDMAVTGRADCVDILEYVNGSEAVGDPENSNILEIPDMDKCTITFVTSDTNPTKVASVNVLTGNSITGSTRYTKSVMPKKPQWDDRYFAGWKTADGKTFMATTVVDSDITVYGQWSYIVTCYPEGGELSNSGEAYQFYVYTGERCFFPIPYRNGYTFGGWYTGKNGTGSQYISNDTVVDSNVSLYANWICTHESMGTNVGWREHSRSGTCAKITIVYKCQRCAAEKISETTGKCNTNSRCNVAHDKGKKFDCTATGGFHRLNVGKYHVTCSKCGGVATNLGTVTVGGNSYNYWYWCGDHGGASRNETATH